MFATARSALRSRNIRLFSSSPIRASHVARLILVGRVGQEPHTRTTTSDKEYMSYSIATNNWPSPPPGLDGVRPEPTTTWHRVLCFNPSLFNFLQNVKKGSLVYVEANFEVREPTPGAEPGTPESLRKVFLRHDHLRILAPPGKRGLEGEEVKESTDA